MGKSDQKKTQNAITAGTTRNLDNTQAGLDYANNQVSQLGQAANTERSNIINDYTGLQGKSAQDYSNDLSIAPGNSGGGSSGGSGGGGGGSSAPAAPDYLSTFRELAGKDAGFDPTRLNDINTIVGQLKDTSGNYGQTNTSIGGLQDFAKSGGISADTLAKIDQPTLEEFAKTGGYNDQQIADLRARSNSAAPSFYQNMKDDMARKQAVQGGLGPGWSAAGFKAARDASQQNADNVRNTEIGIGDTVRAGRSAAAGTLAQNALSTAGIQSNNTLQGYTSSGNLANAEQAQQDQAKLGAGNLDLSTQGTINQTRLGATSGISQDTLGRMSIGASSAAAAASRDQQAREWASGMAQQAQEFGTSGLLSTYQAAPNQLMQDQNLARGYEQDQMQAGQDEVGNRIAASRIPGLGSTISSALGDVGQLASMGSGFGSAFSNYLSPSNGMAGMDPRYIQQGPVQY